MQPSTGRLLIATTVPETMTAFVLPQLPLLRERGWSIDLVTSPGDWRCAVPEGLAARHNIVMSRAMNPLADSKALAQWVALIRQQRPDVVLGSTPKAGLLAMVAARAAGVPRRVFLHRGARWETTDGLQRPLVQLTDKVTVRSATHVLAVSPSLAELLVSEGIAKKAPRVLGQGGSKGVDLSKFHPIPGIPARHGPPTIGYLGRLAADKGLEILFDVLDATRAVNPDARLLIAGAVDAADPPADAVVERIAQDPSIDWLGQVRDPPAFLRQLDLLVFPSRREGLPNAVIEAAACGVPTVGWRVTGVRDAVQHAETGTLVRYGDDRAFVAQSLRILAQRRGAYREACVSWAKYFDQERLALEMADFLESLHLP